MIRNILLTIAVLLAGMTAKAQKFFNLTADEVRIDSVIPTFDIPKTWDLPMLTPYTP